LRRRPDNPLRQLSELRNMLLEALANERRRRPARVEAWCPLMDLEARQDEYVLLLDLPGVSREQIEATAHDSLLRIRGVSAQPDEVSDAREVRHERPLGQFARSVHLPTDADVSRISAKLADGTLEIRVARRRPESSQTKIEIG